MASNARPVDANKLSFSGQFVWGLVCTIVAAAGTVWTMEAGLRSDVRNLSTLMTEQAKADGLRRDVEKERNERAAEKQQANVDALKITIDAIQKDQRLMQLELQNFREQMLSVQGRR